MKRGFSLIEVLVAASLLLLVVTLIAQLLVPSLHLSVRGTERSSLQQTGSLAMARLSEDLLTTNLAAVSWADSVAGSPAVLALQPMDSPSPQGRPAYRNALISYTWLPAATELRREVWNPPPASWGLVTQAPTRLARVTLMQIPSTTLPYERRILSRDAVLLELSSAVAPPNLSNPLTLKLKLSRKGAPDTFEVTRVLSLRNAP